MNLAYGQYTQEELIKALSEESRTVFYEFILVDPHGNFINTISIDNAKISYDSANEVMRTLSGQVRASDIIDIDRLDYYIRPYMCLKYKKDVVRWPLGLFLINLSGDYEEKNKLLEVIGYDVGKIALDDKTDTRTYAPGSTVYTSFAAQVAGTLYSNVNVVPSEKSSSNGLEWDIGTEKLVVINDTLRSINYNPLHFDEYGTGQIKPFVFDEDRTVDHVYQDNDTSVILDGITIDTDRFEVPNKFVRYVENPDAAYLISTYLNDDPNSPYSTVNRGRVIVDIDSVDDIATQGDLDNLVYRIAAQANSTEEIEFSTLNMPGHGYRDCIFLSIKTYGIEGKYIETSWEMDLSEGGLMTHLVKKEALL